MFFLSMVFIFPGCKSDPSSSDYQSENVTYAGKVYHTVKIGNQIWLKENLDVGTFISLNENPSNNGTIEKYCYDNNIANCDTYGGLYQWNEAMQYLTTEGAQGICPPGWHIPTSSEMETLAINVNFSSSALKAIGQGAANIGNGTGSGIGTNTYGFSALLSGYLKNDQSFRELRVSANFWSSTQKYMAIADNMWFYYANNEIHFHETNKSYGFSVRCIKD